jgi:cytochrome c
MALALSACTQFQAERQEHQASVAAGHELVEANCARCHAISAFDESPNPAAPPFRFLARKYPIDSLQEAFAEGAVVGHHDMPQFQFEPEQIDDLVAYLQSIQEPPGS